MLCSGSLTDFSVPSVGHFCAHKQPSSRYWHKSNPLSPSLPGTPYVPWFPVQTLNSLCDFLAHSYNLCYAIKADDLPGGRQQSQKTGFVCQMPEADKLGKRSATLQEQGTTNWLSPETQHLKLQISVEDKWVCHVPFKGLAAGAQSGRFVDLALLGRLKLFNCTVWRAAFFFKVATIVHLSTALIGQGSTELVHKSRVPIRGGISITATASPTAAQGAGPGHNASGSGHTKTMLNLFQNGACTNVSLLQTTCWCSVQCWSCTVLVWASPRSVLGSLSPAALASVPWKHWNQWSQHPFSCWICPQHLGRHAQSFCSANNVK